MKTQTVKQTVQFPVKPKEVYAALMDSKQHSRFTGAKAVISQKVGGSFTAYDGSLEGKHLELVPAKKIVQTWRSDDWPDGHFSKATFRLAKSKSGTRLTFIQTGVPDDQAADIRQGWIDYYWNPMKDMFKEAKRERQVSC